MLSGFFFQPYKPLVPDPKEGPLDPATVALLNPLNVIVYTGLAAFLDIVTLVERFPIDDSDDKRRPVIPSEFRVIDKVNRRYAMLLDATVRAHGACAKYLLCCRRALAWNSKQTELDIVGAYKEFEGSCSEVKETVKEAIRYWEKVADALSDLERSRPSALSLWRLLSFAAPPVTVQYQTLLADFPSLREKAERNLGQFSNAYQGLEDTVAGVEAARTKGVDHDAAIELRRSLKFALQVLLRLESVFNSYRYGFVVVNGELSDELHRWDLDEGIGNLPVERLLIKEKDW